MAVKTVMSTVMKIVMANAVISDDGEYGGINGDEDSDGECDDESAELTAVKKI